MVQRHEEQRPRAKQDEPDAVEVVRDPHFRFGAGYGDLEEQREQANENAPRKRPQPH